MTAIGLLALPGLLLAPPGAPLDSDVFDASALPTVVIDIVVPRDFTAVDLTAPMVQISGGTVESIAKVDPSSVAVSLVIDDGPAVTPEAVTDGQGASVEFVRTVGDGTQISLSTPSGLLTAPTTDREANIARISGIVAGSPDVITMPNLVVDAAKRLAAVPVRDRHLVVVLGTTFPGGAPLQALRDVVIPAGIRLDVVAAAGLDPGTIDDLAVESGGLSPVLPKPVGEMDAVTRAIRDRYHVTGTVDGPGVHDVTLTVGGQTFTSTVDVSSAAPAAPSGAPAATTTVPSTVPPTTGGTATVTPTTAQAATDTPSPTVQAATPRVAPSTTAAATGDGSSSGMSRGARVLIVLLALIAAAAFGTFFVLSQRAKAAATRRRERAAARAAAAEDDAGDEVVTPSDGPEVWDRPTDEPTPETAGETAPAESDAVSAPASAAAAATVAGGSRRRRNKRRPEPQPTDAPEPAAEEAPVPETGEPPAEIAEVAEVAAVAGPVDEVEPVAAGEAERVDVEAAPMAAAAGAAAARAPASARAARRARKKARRQLGQQAAAAAVIGDAPVGDDGDPDPDAADAPTVAEAEPLAEVAAEPEPVVAEPMPVVVEPEPVDVEPVVAEAEPEPEVVAEPAVDATPEPEIESEPDVEDVAPAEPATDDGRIVESAAVDDEIDDAPPLDSTAGLVAGAEAASVVRPRGRPLNDRPRRTSRRAVAPPPVAEPNEIVDEPDATPPRRGRRRGEQGERPPPERTRRGSPADLPKRARARRRFDDIPLIDETPTEAPSVAAVHDDDWLSSGDLRMRRSTGQVIAHGREVSLTRPELGVLELLLRSGSEGVTPDAIKAAAGEGADSVDPDAIVAQLRRKTGVRGRGQGVRKERVLLYFLGEDEAEPTTD